MIFKVLDLRSSSPRQLGNSGRFLMATGPVISGSIIAAEWGAAGDLLTVKEGGPRADVASVSKIGPGPSARWHGTIR
jgi:hypothetical protein